MSHVVLFYLLIIFLVSGLVLSYLSLKQTRLTWHWMASMGCYFVCFVVVLFGATIPG